MIGRRATIGIALLSAMLLCAIVAQSASAAEAKRTTAFTCVESATNEGDFTDEHCDKTGTPKKEKWAHKEIGKTTTEITVTNEKTASSTTASTPTTLRGAPFGVKTHIECSKVHGTGWIQNTEPVGKAHNVSGTITIRDTGCTVKEPANCTVKEIVKTAVFTGVEELGVGKNEMGVEFKEDEGKSFSTFTYEGEKCALKEKPFPITGLFVGTSGTGSQTAGETGTTWDFTESMSSLTAGGKPAFLIGKLTLRMSEKEPGIAYTTVT